VAEGEDAPIELVESAGALDGAVALLRDFVHGTGALRAVGVVEHVPGASPAIVDCGRMTLIEVDLGDRILHLPHGIELDVDVPSPPGLRQLPPFEVDAAQGTVTGTIGGLDHLVANVCALAEALGAANVAMAVFETTNAEMPIAITARAGGSEPVVIAIGEDQFEWDPPGQPPPDAPA
jgi:hypothetical protein